MATPQCPPFKLGQPRYDQSTFQGRLSHFLDVIDPRTLFTSEQKLKESIYLLEQFKAGTLDRSQVTDEQLWAAQKIKQAIIHPDTGKKILPPFRMSGFVPYGTPIVVGLLLPNPTMVQTIFWQWLNQSHNACVNYSNRNATKPTPVSRFLLGYAGAVSSAVGIAIGLTLAVRRANGLSAGAKLFIQRFVPFPAVATASVCNVVLMRNSELSTGIEVFDDNGTVVGTSQAAARKALFETAITRAVLPAPILLIPPIIMSFLDKLRVVKSNRRLQLLINTVLVVVSFGGALPVAIALFPQVSKIATDQMEPHLRTATLGNYLYYNKGL